MIRKKTHQRQTITHKFIRCKNLVQENLEMDTIMSRKSPSKKSIIRAAIGLLIPLILLGSSFFEFLLKIRGGVLFLGGVYFFGCFCFSKGLGSGQAWPTEHIGRGTAGAAAGVPASGCSGQLCPAPRRRCPSGVARAAGAGTAPGGFPALVVAHLVVKLTPLGKSIS